MSGREILAVAARSGIAVFALVPAYGLPFVHRSLLAGRGSSSLRQRLKEFLGDYAPDVLVTEPRTNELLAGAHTLDTTTMTPIAAAAALGVPPEEATTRAALRVVLAHEPRLARYIRQLRTGEPVMSCRTNRTTGLALLLGLAARELGNRNPH